MFIKGQPVFLLIISPNSTISHCIKYARIRVSEKPYPRILYVALSDPNEF